MARPTTSPSSDSWTSTPERCTKTVHVLQCTHLVTSEARTSCASNCHSPRRAAHSYTYECRTCRSARDARFFAAADELRLGLSLCDPALMGAAWDEAPPVSLHDPTVPDRALARLHDPLPGRKVWFAYLRRGAVRTAYAFVLDTSLRRYLAEKRTRFQLRDQPMEPRAARHLVRKAAGRVRRAERRARRDAQRSFGGRSAMLSADVEQDEQKPVAGEPEGEDRVQRVLDWLSEAGDADSSHVQDLIAAPSLCSQSSRRSSAQHGSRETVFSYLQALTVAPTSPSGQPWHGSELYDSGESASCLLQAPPAPNHLQHSSQLSDLGQSEFSFLQTLTTAPKPHSQSLHCGSDPSYSTLGRMWDDVFTLVSAGQIP